MSTPQYLIRVWGRDWEQVRDQYPPAVVESDHVLCYWFETPEQRQQFAEVLRPIGLVVRSFGDPGTDHNGEVIDTHARTLAKVTLRLPDGREGTFVQDFGYGYPAHSAEFMWREGNYSCDCNRRLYLARQCGIDPENDDLDTAVCGDSIELVSLEISKEAQ